MVFTASLFVSSLVISSSAQAAEKKQSQKQAIQYDVFAGGIHALQANLDLSVPEKNRYSSILSAKTYGLLGKLAPWHGTFESHGWSGTPNKPEMHQSTTTWKNEREIKTYKYNKDGSFKGYTIKDPDNDGKPQEVDAKLVQGTTDILSSTLDTMQAIAGGEKCEGSGEIFDGKRRYKMIFKQKAEVELEASRWNVYAGPAIQCTVEVQPVAGKWHEKPRGWMSIQEQGVERGTMPTVWFAKVSPDKPAVPVKVRVKTAYGTLFMHMTKYDDGSKKLALKK